MQRPGVRPELISSARSFVARAYRTPHDYTDFSRGKTPVQDCQGESLMLSKSRQPRLIMAMLLLCGAIACAQSPHSHPAPLKEVAEIPSPGAAVRFDYQSFDPAQGRLYISHMNANELVVFDVNKREVVANLEGFPSVHGVWAVPELGKVYASATGEHKLAVVDIKTLKTIAKVGPINYPDGIAYAPAAKRVFVSDEHGDADAVIDATNNTLVTTIPLGGGAANTVYDPASGHILVAVHENNHLLPIDPATVETVGRYP